MDQLVDLGVELFCGPLERFWEENVTPFDAILVSRVVDRGAWRALAPSMPSPVFVEEHSWLDVADSLQPPRAPVPQGDSARRTAAGLAFVAAPPRPPDEDDARLERELRAAQSELAVKNAYIAKLERDVENMTAARDRLPQTRAKRSMQRLVGRERWAALAAGRWPHQDREAASSLDRAQSGRPKHGVAGDTTPGPSDLSAAIDLTDPWMVVMGMHRSGTSAVTGALGRLGLVVPAEVDWLDPDESNPDHFESRSMMLFDEMLLRMYGGSWDSPPHLPAGWSDSREVRALDGEARAAIARAFPGGGPAAFKDPRACLCLPLWQRVASVPMAAVFVWRSPLAVARSLEKRNGFDLLLGVALWERYNAAALEVMAGMDVFVTSFEGMLADPATRCSEIAEWLDALEPWRRLGRQWRVEDAAAAFIGERRHQDDEDVSSLLESQSQLLEILRALDGPYTGFETPTLPSVSPWATALVEAHHFENVASRARREADGMRGSVSWRMTAPIRKASSRARPKPPS
jgi:hypothetical protein